MIHKGLLHDPVGVLTIRRLDHLTDINILNRVIVLPKAEVTTHGCKISCLESSTKIVLTIHITTHLLQGRADELGRIISLAGVESRRSTISRTEGLNKSPVLRGIQIRTPLRTIDDTKARIAHGLKEALIKRKGGAEQGNRFIQAGLGILFNEVNTHSTGQKEKDRIRSGSAKRGQFRCVIGLTKVGIHLTGNPTLVKAFETRYGILPTRIVGS